MGQLDLNEIRDIDALPLVLDQQVLAGGEPVDAIEKARDKGCRIAHTRGLLGNRLHHGEQVHGAMIDLGHEQFVVLLGPLPLRDVADVALDDGLAVLIIEVGHHFDFLMPSSRLLSGKFS